MLQKPLPKFTQPHMYNTACWQQPGLQSLKAGFDPSSSVYFSSANKSSLLLLLIPSFGIYYFNYNRGKAGVKEQHTHTKIAYPKPPMLSPYASSSSLDF